MKHSYPQPSGVEKEEKEPDSMHLMLKKKTLTNLKLDQMVTLTIRGKVTRLSHDEFGFCLDVEPVKVNVGNGGDTES